MPSRPDLAAVAAKRDIDVAQTLDLRQLAMLLPGEKVEVEAVADRTLDAFDETLTIISDRGADAGLSFSENILRKIEIAPKDSELRQVFVFAEILGGYDAFNELVRENSPAGQVSERFQEVVNERELTPRELMQLESYHQGLSQSVNNAKTYYRESKLKGLTLEEMNELYAMVTRARDIAHEINAVIGKHLILRMESAIAELNAIRLKSLSVEQTLSGVFLVDDEVMFIPVGELQEAVGMIFKGVGNPYLAKHADGVMLLAARNLIIEVVSFFAYYGKAQIYQLFKQGQTVDRKRMALRIRAEIKKLLETCRADNKLVLTRIMDKEAQQLDLSIEAIRREAEKQAVDIVSRLIPDAPPAPPPAAKKNWLQKMAGWFGGA